jgi:hypothetical protein
MGKASSSKKVARAAGTGGGRTSRGKAPVLWYGSLLVIIIAGIGLTTFSRDQRLEALNSPESKEEPRANEAHWHVALGVRVCDRWLDPLTDQSDPKGIHTHGDGIIHVHPFVASAAGRRATFERYAEVVKGSKLERDRFAWPEGDGKKIEDHRTGDKCGEQEAEVKAFYNGQPHDGDPGEIRLTDRGKLVLAFVPKGTTYEQIGDPPSTSGLDNLSDVAPTEQNQSQATPPVSVTPGDGTATTVAPTGTTAPGATTETTAAAPATTAAAAPATTAAAAPATTAATTAAPPSSAPPSSAP